MAQQIRTDDPAYKAEGPDHGCYQLRKTLCKNLQVKYKKDSERIKLEQAAKSTILYGFEATKYIEMKRECLAEIVIGTL